MPKLDAATLAERINALCEEDQHKVEHLLDDLKFIRRTLTPSDTGLAWDMVIYLESKNSKGR